MTPLTGKLDKWKKDRKDWANGHGNKVDWPGPRGTAPEGPDAWANEWEAAMEQWGDHIVHHLEIIYDKINQLADQHGSVDRFPDPEVPPPPDPPFD